MGSVGALLLQAAGSDAARQATAGGGLLEVLAIIAIAIVALLLIALLVMLIPAVRTFRKASEKMEAVIDRISGELDPIVGHAKSIADNADYISTAIRADVGSVSLTVRRANDRLNEALDASERRVRELGALLRVFQDEVEHTFVSGTSALRGMRAGAGALRDGTLDFLDELDDLDDEALEDEALEDEELDDEPEDYVDEPGEFPESGTILDSNEIDDEIEDTLEEGEEIDNVYDWARDGRDGGDDSEERPRIRRRPTR